MSDLISVLTPVYNTGIYLRRYFESVLNQSYKNIEVILIDDGSRDKLTLDIIKEYEAKDNRVKVYRQENHGLSYAYNRALDRVSGNYITFIDSDDYLKVDAIEVMYKELVDNDYDLVQASYIVKYDNFSLYRTKPNNKILNKDEALEALSSNTKVNNYVWAKMYRSDLLKDIRFNETYNNFSDMEYTAEVMLRVKRIKTINKRVYYYYQRSGSSTNSMNYKEAFKMFEGFKKQEALINNNSLYKISNHKSYYRSEIYILYTYLVTKEEFDLILPDYDDSRIWLIFKIFRFILFKIVCLKKKKKMNIKEAKSLYGRSING